MNMTLISVAFLLAMFSGIHPNVEKKLNIEVKSSAFQSGELIPVNYTCEGKNISPEIHWKFPGNGVKSYALICDDPDAPRGDWVHWVVYNIPSGISELKESFRHGKKGISNIMQGKNDFGDFGYGGPCPPSGTHRYFFKVYALDIMLNQTADFNKAGLLKAIEGHIVGYGELIGKYRRK